MQLKMDCELNNIDNSATQGFTQEKISLEESKIELELINEFIQKLFTLENLNNDLQRTEIMGNLETFKQRCEELELEIQQNKDKLILSESEKDELLMLNRNMLSSIETLC